jgi:hypothetical protein
MQMRKVRIELAAAATAAAAVMRQQHADGLKQMRTVRKWCSSNSSGALYSAAQVEAAAWLSAWLQLRHAWLLAWPLLQPQHLPFHCSGCHYKALPQQFTRLH